MIETGGATGPDLGLRADADSQAAWQEYLDTLQWARTKLINHRNCRDEGDRTRALYGLQSLLSTSFNTYMAPRRTRPKFYSQHVEMLFELGWGQACADFNYRFAFLEGRNTYRVWGRLGTTQWSDIGVLDGFWGDAKSIGIGNIEPAAHADEDGNFEIIFSPDPQPGKVWVQIPRETRNVTLCFREAWEDWENDIGITIQVEPLHVVEEPEWTFTEAEINQRVRECATWVRTMIEFGLNMIDHIESKAGARNRFVVEWDKELLLHGKEIGGNPKALKARAVYDFAPDECLIVEVVAPRAVYWSYSIGDIWYQTLDYSYHQSSLNSHQTHIDTDGMARFVMAVVDPGVPNWVDTVGTTQGSVNFRFYLPIDGYAPKPVVRKVKLGELRMSLPADTPRVSAEARAEQLKRRAKAANARYGY